ncbi:helix-turn-helix transcriptional regulator [Vreelandella alkaliphila]|uniref:Helix-turn-helix transcriptional regulator n=1 Tax=Vreelandella alkaliphila TaxID=272774 RepID=A0A7C9JUV2_9GAMM|nr:helix-turn-helix transcriptional regulator [Halomonas alkaliphila]NDL71863.1 helix-turn-helix transcriptional regulator [Halomonas alkaliphila]
MAFFSFSTRQFAPNERLEAAQDIYSAMAQVQLRAPKKQTPHVETRIRLLPGVSIASVTASSLHASRKSPQVADGNDDITFLIHPGGTGGWLSHLQAHDSLACTPGRARIVLNHQLGSVDFYGERANFLSIAFSRAQLMPLIDDLDRLPKTLLPPGEPLQHLTRLALALTRRSDAINGHSTAQLSGQLLDLACLSLGATRDAGIRSRRGGLRDARLKAIKADINMHARTPLCLEDLALRHSVSPSYIRALFNSKGTSFTDYLLEQRLQLAFDALTNTQATQQRSVSDIAFRAGFNHLSWFYRAFKHRFGIPPGEARHIATHSRY